MSVLKDASILGQPFRAFSENLRGVHVGDNVQMVTALKRVFQCPEAIDGKDMVLIWALDHPYTHSDGNGLPSTIVYIEKAKSSARNRWPIQHLRKLAQDFTSRPLLKLDDLRQLAKQNRNYSFYSRIIEMYGPLSVWQASTQELNSASSDKLDTSREWEHRLLLKYFEHHRCFPLKNRRA